MRGVYRLVRVCYIFLKTFFGADNTLWRVLLQFTTKKEGGADITRTLGNIGTPTLNFFSGLHVAIAIVWPCQRVGPRFRQTLIFFQKGLPK